MKLSELFHLVNGVPAGQVPLSDEPGESTIRFLRPSKSMHGLLLGYAEKDDIPAERCVPSDSIIVPTNGEGSLAYAVVYPYECAFNSDVAALIPKDKYKSVMTWSVKQYYAATIRANRFRYGYARKPKGQRLTDLDVPAPSEIPIWASQAEKLDYSIFSTVPEWVFEQGFDRAYELISNMDFDGFEKHYGSALDRHDSIPVFPLSLECAEFTLDQLFDIQYGVNLEKADLEEDPHGILFVGRSAYNNGVTGRVAVLDDVEPSPAGSISVAGGGSVLSTFVQRERWYSGRDVFVLTPKETMSVGVKTFICELIHSHATRFSFGRQANIFIPKLQIPLPVDSDGKPDFQTIDLYMKSLKFSASLR